MRYDNYCLTKVDLGHRLIASSQGLI
jgi:hypothetical protein